MEVGKGANQQSKSLVVGDVLMHTGVAESKCGVQLLRAAASSNLVIST